MLSISVSEDSKQREEGFTARRIFCGKMEDYVIRLRLVIRINVHYAFNYITGFN